MSDQSSQDTLEEIVDQRGLQQVLGLLSAVCFEKAEHLASNWQDERAAAQWRVAGRRLDRFSATEAIGRIS